MRMRRWSRRILRITDGNKGGGVLDLEIATEGAAILNAIRPVPREVLVENFVEYVKVTATTN